MAAHQPGDVVRQYRLLLKAGRSLRLTDQVNMQRKLFSPCSLRLTDQVNMQRKLFCKMLS